VAKLPPADKVIRLNKYLSECGVASRRHADEMILQGRVMVNGTVVNSVGHKVDTSVDEVKVNRKVIRLQEKGVALFHKPTGVVTTMSDPEGRPCIADYLTKKQQGYYPAGRLDWDSSGLVVLTNDGELAEALMHPRYGCLRVYHVKVEGIPSDRICEKLLKGVRLDDGMVSLCSIKIITGDRSKGTRQSSRSDLVNDDGETGDGKLVAGFEITIKEGRNRIIRRLFSKVGHPVKKLKRVAHGAFRLGTLPVGRMKVLSQRDYEFMRAKIVKKSD
jgi:23S rRNA pseudouridine2605 synthase